MDEKLQSMCKKLSMFTKTKKELKHKSEKFKLNLQTMLSFISITLADPVTISFHLFINHQPRHFTIRFKHYKTLLLTSYSTNSISLTSSKTSVHKTSVHNSFMILLNQMNLKIKISIDHAASTCKVKDHT